MTVTIRATAARQGFLGIVLCAGVALGGCLVPPPPAAYLPRATPRVPPAPAPICSDPNDCELMWAAARRWVIENAGYKFQTLTNDFLETYNSTTASLAARVIKEPLGGGRYEFVATIACGDPDHCVMPLGDALNSFNLYVGAAGSGNAARAPASLSAPAPAVEVSVEQAWNDCLAAVRDQHPRSSRVGFPAYDIRYLEKQDGQHFTFHSTALEQPAKGIPVKRAWRCTVNFENGHSISHELSFQPQ
jgi:hypothetical protein